MAFTTGQTTAQMITELQSVNANLNPDAIMSFLTQLAQGWPVPVGTPTMFATVLVKCTTGYATPPGTTPVYAYDATPS